MVDIAKSATYTYLRRNGETWRIMETMSSACTHSPARLQESSFGIAHGFSIVANRNIMYRYLKAGMYLGIKTTYNNQKD